MKTMRHGRKRDYEIVRSPDGGLTVKTDGTKEDHAAALEMLGAISNSPMYALENLGRIPLPEPPSRPPAEESRRRPEQALSMQEGIGKWHLTLSNKPEKTQRMMRSYVQKFREWMESERKASKQPIWLADVSRRDCANWQLELKRRRLSEDQIFNYFSYLKSFFRWAIASAAYPKGDNPATEHVSITKEHRKKRAESHGWQAFDSNEIGKIFDPASFGAFLKYDAARWLPVLALYTGARANELARLESPRV